MIGKVVTAIAMLPVYAAAAYFIPSQFAWFVVGWQIFSAISIVVGYVRMKSDMEKASAMLLMRYVNLYGMNADK